MFPNLLNFWLSCGHDPGCWTKLCAFLQENRDNSSVAEANNPVQRPNSFYVQFLHVCSIFEQNFDHFTTSLIDSHIQGAAA